MQSKWWLKVWALVGIVVLFTGGSLLWACGGDDDTEGENDQPTSTKEVEEKVVTIGALVDMTGPTAGAQVPMYYAYRDYYKYVEEEDPIEGIKLNLITYDTQYDPGRIPQGYVDLKSRGADVMHIITGSNAEGLRSRFQKDGIPFVGAKITIKLIDADYYHSTASLPEIEQEKLFEYIVNGWDYDTMGRSPKLGFIGMAGNPWSVDPKDKLQELAESNEDKVDWAGAEMIDRTQMTFANEAQNLKDCDYIVIQIAGPGGPAFIKEALTRGYEGDFAGSAEVFSGFWMLYEDALPSEWLDGLVMTTVKPSWSDDTPWVNKCEEYTEKYLSGADLTTAKKQFTNRMDGWTMGQITAEAIRRAAEKVGPENVDSEAINEEIKNTYIEDSAFGIPLKYSEDIHAVFNATQIRQYDAQTEEWVPMSDWTIASFAEEMYE